jgi:TonB family protein
VTSHITLVGMLSYALHSGLVLMVGLLVPRLLRLHHPRTLLVYWRLLLPTVVLLPLATAIWQPKNPLPILAIDGAVVEEVVATALNSNTVDFNWWLLLAPVLVVTAIAMTRIAIGLAYLARCRRGATPIIPLPAQVDALQRRLGLEVPFVSTPRLSVPITFGWARPIVMVPTSFNRLSADEQEGVACHELLHIHRRDWPVALAEEIVRAILWFHPAVWLLLPKIALSREQVVDAGTVDMTGKRRQYLDALWQIVVCSQNPAAAFAVPLIGRSHLRARVEHLKKENAMSKTRIIASVVVLVVSVAAAGYVGATVFSAAASTTADTLSAGNPWSTEDDKPQAHDEKNKGEESKLETWDHDGECAEITDPEAIEKVSPKYPEEARKARIMGLVKLKATITDQGLVEDLEVLESPDEMLTDAAVEATRQWRFKPALCDGKPVGVYYNLTIKFNLE